MQEIKVLRSSVTAHEREVAERATLVTQERLVKAKARLLGVCLLRVPCARQLPFACGSGMLPASRCAGSAGRPWGMGHRIGWRLQWAWCFGVTAGQQCYGSRQQQSQRYGG